MKIGLITQWYPPEHGSAALPGTIAAALDLAGNEVEVVTGFPNYPHGELQEGWRQSWGFHERRSGATVYRTPVYISHDENPVRRMINYVSFALSASLTALRRLRSVDVVWVHGTPVLPALPAMALRSLLGIPFVLHIQDLWPDTVLASGMLPRRLDRLVRKPLEWFCNRAYRSASVIGIITPGMRRALVSRGVPSEKIVDIPNWADEEIFRPVPRRQDVLRELGLPTESFIAMYAGAIGEVQGLQTLVRAAALLRDEPDIHVAIVGDGIARTSLKKLADTLDLTNVTFVPAQPLDQMSQVLTSADVQIVCLKDLPLYRITLPSKIQATLATGTPLIVSAGGDAGRVVVDAAAGRSCPAGDADALAVAMRDLATAGPAHLASLGSAGRRYYESQFSQSTGVERMLRALARAHSDRKTREDKEKS